MFEYRPGADLADRGVRGSCNSRWFGLVFSAIMPYHGITRRRCLLAGLLISHNRCNARVRLGVARDEWLRRPDPCERQRINIGYQCERPLTLLCGGCQLSCARVCDKKLQPRAGGMVLSCLLVALWSCARAATRAVDDVNGWKGVRTCITTVVSAMYLQTLLYEGPFYLETE